jgi:hypothetical protein
MNILYITRGDHVDYQNDCLLIGLKQLFGSSVIDVQKQHHLYDSYPDQYVPYLYGRGFTIPKVLKDETCDRSDILSKIRNRYFDLVVYGSIWRSPGSRGDLPHRDTDNYLLSVLEYYPKNKIVFIDGNDELPFHPIMSVGVPYFKRELVDKPSGVFPISFAIPDPKVNINKNKIRDNSFITPKDISTYIYNKEYDYYSDYSKSRFGVTMKKGGWDCMRHYEIMANGCIPEFIDIDNCPDNTMVNFPKLICSQVLKDLKVESAENVYSKHIDNLIKHFMENCTTTSLAKYFLDTMNSI